MKVKRDQLTGAALFLLGIVIAILVSQFRIGFKPGYPGPMLFPLISVFGFIICGAGIFLQSTFGKEEEEVFLLKEGWLRLGISFVILTAYVLALSVAGFLIATPFALFAISTMYAKGQTSQRKYRIIFSIGFTLLVYVIYEFAFGLRLPGGILF